MNNYYFCVYEMSKKIVEENEVNVVLEDNDDEEIKFKPGSTMDEYVKREKKIVEKSSNAFGSVPDKFVKDLTSDERTLILKNYVDGKENDNFTVHQLKNGSLSIKRKRTGKVKSLDDAVIKNVTNTSNKSGRNMTNEQMLIQNIIDMEKRLEKESLKRKLLKRKYKKMKSDIYVDDEENENEIIISPNDVNDNNNNESDDKIDVKVESNNVEEEVSKQVVEPQNRQFSQPIRRKLSYREQLLLRAQQYGRA